MKTVAIVFVLFCVCLVHCVREQRWGFPVGTELGRKEVVADSLPGEVQVRAFDFSGKIKKDLKIPITGIKHFDYADRPVNVTFVYGEVNRNHIAILVKSEAGHGINSTFVFYRN